MDKRYITAVMALLFCTSLGLLHAQNMDSTTVRQKVEGKKYTFIAQTANALRGKTVQLTTVYDLRVSGDSVIAQLPYFGRAFSAPMNPSEGGINFTSTDAEYKSVYRKKRWEITIKPRDTQSARELNLTVYPNGRANLQVNSNNRQPISFFGILSEK